MQKMLYANSSISTAVDHVLQNLTPEEQLYLPYNPLVRDNDVIRYVRIKRLAFITMHDFKDKKYKEKHPIEGLVVTIAGLESSKKAGDLDFLIKHAISDARMMEDESSKFLVAEINKSDKEKQELFSRNGFKLIAENEETFFYSCSTRS